MKDNTRACIVDHRALMAALRAMQTRYDITPRDVMANWVPLHHASGLVRHVFGTVAYGSPSHLITPSVVATARWLPLITQVRATLTTAPDSAYRLATQLVSPADVDLRSLRFAGSGGESVRADTIRGFEARFGLSRVVQPAYGLSEGTLAIAANPPGAELIVDDAGAVSCGTAIDGVDIRVVDDAGVPCPPGTVGELQFRGATLFRGYFDDAVGTQAVMRPGGWCQPGDRAVLDVEGRVFIRARTRALIKRGGAGLAPREVEEPVCRLPGVIACAAVGARRAARSTEDLVVVVETHGQATDLPTLVAAVQRACVEAVHVLPAAVFVVEAGALPRSAAGKVLYSDVRALVEGAGFGSATLCVG